MAFDSKALIEKLSKIQPGLVYTTKSGQEVPHQKPLHQMSLKQGLLKNGTLSRPPESKAD
eukprot:3535561-Lingulodinium_polyedra.AAC.1